MDDSGGKLEMSKQKSITQKRTDDQFVSEHFIIRMRKEDAICRLAQYREKRGEKFFSKFRCKSQGSLVRVVY